MEKPTSDWSELMELIIKIVAEAARLKDRYKVELDAPVSYCAVFCKTPREFKKFTNICLKYGQLAKETSTGPIFVMPSIPTVYGPLRIIKIRKPDKTRLERGDADFAALNYEELKSNHLGSKGFKLIKRGDFEMIELLDDEFDSRVYFSNPPVEQHEGIRELLESN